MATYIISGNYSAEGMRGMIANPSDRVAAVKPLLEASGGKICRIMLRWESRISR